MTLTECWLNIRRHHDQIGTKSTTSEARKRKEPRRWKGEKRKVRKFTACENGRKRAYLIFPSLEESPLQRTLSRAYLVFRDWKQLKSQLRNRLSLIVRVNVILNRTVFDSDWRFDNLCGSHLQSQSELIVQLRKQLIVKPYICLPQRQTRHACLIRQYL